MLVLAVFLETRHVPNVPMLEYYFSKSFRGEVEVDRNGVSKIQHLTTMVSSVLLKGVLTSIFATARIATAFKRTQAF